MAKIIVCATGVAQSVKVLACLSEVALGRGSIPAWADYLVEFFPRFSPTVSEWREAIKMNANVSAVRSVPGRSSGSNLCRRCDREVETLAHVLGACPHGELLRNTRHHTLRSIIAIALRNKGYSVYEEVHGISSEGSNRRIDIIAFKPPSLEEERCSAAIKATYDIKKHEKLSTTTALRLFHMKIAPIVSYALKRYGFSNLNLNRSRESSYLKKSSSLFFKNNANEAGIPINGHGFLRKKIMTSNGLQPTPAYEAHVRDREEKAADVDQEFLQTPAMNTEEWKKPNLSYVTSSRGRRPTGSTTGSVPNEDTTRPQSSASAPSVQLQSVSYTNLPSKD
ncbi:hypothetical protein ANN_25614 [Periplaneta americana]|uniref:Reverse transcriptase n=1 Tax=Periplaneta americana TaxID=6978 RepID=A0ABQ8S1W3_PERAM|nr:hypothetical protein ANN_25614 [Periplaneta americana]